MTFAKKLLTWYQAHGRHELPWQKNPTPYRVWISEIMLQQTQVSTAIPYYHRFMRNFPSLKSLATANLDHVLSHWSGLGYYARARNLHRAAIILHKEQHGRFPKNVEALKELPGIGLSTAGAIASFSMNIPATILDGNVKRVLTRYFAVEGWPGKTEVHQQLWAIAKANTPEKNVNHYNQAIMDLGAMICTRTKPKCSLCPFTKDCIAHQENRETEFPYRKKAAKRPTKQIQTLLLQQHSGEILLERRPPTGIWGGLWGFPECSLDEDLKKYCQEHYQVKVLDYQKWDLMHHQFSHFHLEINPVLLIIKPNGLQIMDSDSQLWYNISDELPGGIPAPVKKLLARIEK